MEEDRKFSPTQSIGNDYETYALSYFEAQGWQLLERNFHCRAGEVDLIMRDPEGTIVFVEVKFRTSDDYGAAQDFVSFPKQSRIIKAALYFIRTHPIQNRNYRFDVAAVSPGGLEHIPNAFSAEGWTV